MLKRRSREISIFNLSMLDVFASAMAAFLIIMIILLPYYERDAIADRSQIAALRQALDATRDALAKAEAAREAAEAQAEAFRPRDLDLMLLLDTTGSMGAQIASLQRDAKGLVRILNALSAELRVGLIAYRDRGPEERYLTQVFPLTTMTDLGFRRLAAFIDALDADGGGDDPEAIDAALDEALAQPWRDGADGVIVVIGDAPVHAEKRSTTLTQAERFSARSDRYRLSTISAGPASGYFRALAEAGDGVFIAGTTALLESIILSMVVEE